MSERKPFTYAELNRIKRPNIPVAEAPKSVPSNLRSLSDILEQAERRNAVTPAPEIGSEQELQINNLIESTPSDSSSGSAPITPAVTTFVSTSTSHSTRNTKRGAKRASNQLPLKGLKRQDEGHLQQINENILNVNPAVIEPPPSYTQDADRSSTRIFVPLDSTHTSAEQMVYSIMYRNTISRGLRERRFSVQELIRLTGINGPNTVRRALRGLQRKLSIEYAAPPLGIYGPIYRVVAPKEIFERRTRVGIIIDPITKQIAEPGKSVTSSIISSATPSARNASRGAKMESLTPSKMEPHINNTNSDDSADASSSHEEGDDGNSSREVRKLFERLSNGGSWKEERDTTAYAQIAHVPVWHVIMGLCYSITRCPEHKMSSLAYAVPSILEHYDQMKVFPETAMLELAYRNMRRTLNCMETGKWTIAEWDKGPEAGGQQPPGQSGT